MSKSRINGTATTVPTNKKHHYMATTLVTYNRDIEVSDGTQMVVEKVRKQKHMNAILHSNKKLITYDMIRQGQIAVTQRCHDELGVKAEDLTDFIYMNIVYCGLMTEDEFQGK